MDSKEMNEVASSQEILMEVPEGTSESDQVDALMGYMGVSRERALELVQRFNG